MRRREDLTPPRSFLMSPVDMTTIKQSIGRLWRVASRLVNTPEEHEDGIPLNEAQPLAPPTEERDQSEETPVNEVLPSTRLIPAGTEPEGDLQQIVVQDNVVTSSRASSPVFQARRRKSYTPAPGQSRLESWTGQLERADSSVTIEPPISPESPLRAPENLLGPAPGPPRTKSDERGRSPAREEGLQRPETDAQTVGNQVDHQSRPHPENAPERDDLPEDSELREMPERQTSWWRGTWRMNSVAEQREPRSRCTMVILISMACFLLALTALYTWVLFSTIFLPRWRSSQ
ncbi:uncharacterized protein LOC106656989 [Trichogramma pretiosum]|uniref:uncharacterized protein LOC106656989 n=1 Tax=Trichogramma pretiosum TaxID=7493 RepID=UPI0006C9DF70|nr:uncharacterized protein LOC106656989 [Trichogramma pretiosum]